MYPAGLGALRRRAVAALCAGPISHALRNEVLNRLITSAWYLHSSRDGRLFFKNVQNLVARLL
jgi:hypothetical protein